MELLPAFSKVICLIAYSGAVRLELAMFIASLRFHGVVFPEKYRHPPYPDAAAGIRSLWGYVDIQDAVSAYLKALDTSSASARQFPA